MAAPATSGQLRSTIADMQIGDYIPFRYVASSGAAGTFSELGTCIAAEISVVGSATPDGKAFFLKVASGLLIADRVIQHSISWDTLNAGGFIEGKKINLGQDVLIRSLSGGCACSDASGNKSTTDQSQGGWPTTNEWDTYIVNGTLNGTITAGDNNVWNYSSKYNWCLETPVVAISANTNRINRGSTLTTINTANPSSYIHSSRGFRPALQYIEAPATTLFY